VGRGFPSRGGFLARGLDYWKVDERRSLGAGGRRRTGRILVYYQIIEQGADKGRGGYEPGLLKKMVVV